MRKCVRFISFCHICCKTMFFFEVSVSNIFFQLVSPTSNVTAIARTPRPLQMRMWRKVLMRFWRQDTWRFATRLDKKASLLVGFLTEVVFVSLKYGEIQVESLNQRVSTVSTFQESTKSMAPSPNYGIRLKRSRWLGSLERLLSQRTSTGAKVWHATLQG